MKMKASHQKILIEQIKAQMGLAVSIGSELDEADMCRSSISSRNRIRT
jgi:hypothetical protein